MDLLQHIDQIFSPTGMLVQLGGRYTAEQHKYAVFVGKSLINEDFTLSFLEAETGIGKTLGYLTPILIHLALKQAEGKNCGKMIISTYSRQLQKQIFDSDLEFAKKLVNSIGLETNFLAAYRMGRQAFFSLERTINCCKRLRISTPAREKELQAFVNYVKHSTAYGSGLWSSYLTDYGCFPQGISINDVCLLDNQTIDSEAYSQHLERAKHCDILITNHYSLLQPGKTGLADIEIEAVILDEAHTISELCFELFNNRSSLNEIKKEFFELGTIIGNTKLKKSNAALTCIETTIKSSAHNIGSGIICETNDPENFKDISNCVYTISTELKHAISVLEKKTKKSDYSLEDVEFSDNIKKIQQTFNNWQSEQTSKFQMSAITLSEVQCKPSLTSLNIFGSRLFASIIKNLTNKVVLTSGTISDISNSGGFNDLKRDLGFKDTEISFECSLAPKSYGKMKFVLCGKHIPKPISSSRDEDETIFDADWLNNTVKMIKKAKDSGNPILVLTVSHQESALLAKMLGDESDILVHRSGNTLTELSRTFTLPENQYKILITSAGWEGLNLRDHEDNQFIHHLFISRLPFIPPQVLHEFLVKEFIRKNHKVNKDENNLNWVNILKKVIPKLQQGFGRGTRGPDDEITVWIADSRMPHSRKDRLSPLLKAIPKRFMDNYHQAEIFGEEKKEIFFI